MKKYPSVSIIILTCSQKEKTIRCLTSINNIDYNNYSILLIDNGSTDNTIESVEKIFPNITYKFFEKNLGVAGGRNRGAEIALKKFNPDYLLFIDNDTTVEKDFLTKMIDNLLQDKEYSIATPKIKFYSNPEKLYGAGGCDIKFWRGKTSHKGYGEKDKGQYDSIEKCVSSGGCMLVKSSVFQELNGFDEIYNPYGPEDLDFVLRGMKKKYKCKYIFNSIIYHDPEPGRTLDRGKYTLEYAKRKLKLLKIFNNRHAPIFEKLIFKYFIAQILILKANLKFIFR